MTIGNIPAGFPVNTSSLRWREGLRRRSYAEPPPLDPGICFDVQGCYSSVHPDKATADKLAAYIAEQGIPNPVPREKLQAGVIFSTVSLPDYQPRRQCTVIPRDAYYFRVFPDHHGQKALFLCFPSKALEKQYRQAVSQGARSPFNRASFYYMTLSYDIGNWNYANLTPPDFHLIFGPEMVEPLHMNWPYRD